MTEFEKDKADKLRRLRGLRIMNAIGLVAWREDRYGCAQQKLRMLHPLSWFWTLGLLLLAVVAHGAIEVWSERKRLFEEMVWW